MLVYRGEHDRATTSRLVGTMSLFLLAVSFVHLGSGHARQIWSQELAFHHAAIPLALLVLLQDYRFVLLDAFFRFLANVFLAAVFVFGVVEAWRWGFCRPPTLRFTSRCCWRVHVSCWFCSPWRAAVCSARSRG